MALTTGIEHLTPSPSKGTLFAGNYITDFDFTKQFLQKLKNEQTINLSRICACTFKCGHF